MLNLTVLVIHIMASAFLIIFILLHSGKGGGLSDMFGGGSTSLSGGTSVERNLDRITVVTAIVFGLTTFWLAWRWS